MAKRVAATRRAGRWRTCLGITGWSLFVVVMVLFLAAGGLVASFYFFPPFKHQRVARVLVVGLDEPARGRLPATEPRRSDTILLTSVRLDGTGATLISVPRDARVRLPGRHRYTKINAAYAEGRLNLLRDTLAQSQVMNASLPYYFVLDSETVHRVVDALGGVTIDVPYDMNYDDSWGGLHIHLRKGRQRLDGGQAVGFLRWRKNNIGGGGGHGDDFSRAARQRALLIALAQQARTTTGMRPPARCLPGALAHIAGPILTCANYWYSVTPPVPSTPAPSPATPRMIGGISYVICDWSEGRRLWQQAVRCQ